MWPFEWGDAQEPGMVPPGFLSIRRSDSREFISLSKAEKPLLQSENDRIVNAYSFDLLINPSWQVAGGIYNCAVVFTLTSQ